MCNLFCNIVKLFNLVVASCAKTDWIKLRVSYSIHGVYVLSVTTSRHLQRPDLLHNNRQGHPTGIIEKKTWKQQQSMINAFWSHFKHFERLLGKSYRFLTLISARLVVEFPASKVLYIHPASWLTAKFPADTTFVQPLPTSLAVVRGLNLSSDK